MQDTWVTRFYPKKDTSLRRKKPTPFYNFVSFLVESRLEAKKAGNEPMSYVYNTLIHSL